MLFFTIYFPGFVCFVLYKAKISGGRLHDHWSSVSWFFTNLLENYSKYFEDLLALRRAIALCAACLPYTYHLGHMGWGGRLQVLVIAKALKMYNPLSFLRGPHMKRRA